MTSPGQEAYVEYLRRSFIGPRGGDEEVLDGSPVYSYLSGMVFPVEEGEGVAPDTLDEDCLARLRSMKREIPRIRLRTTRRRTTSADSRLRRDGSPPRWDCLSSTMLPN